MNFEQWWEEKTTPDFRQNIGVYYKLSKDKNKDFVKEAKIDDSMDDVDVWIFSQPISGKGKLEFFFNWRYGSKPTFFTKSLGQQSVNKMGTNK